MLVFSVVLFLWTAPTATGQLETWDPADPVDMAEGREYFLRWWAGHDAGDEGALLQDYRFTHPPMSAVTLMEPALNLFEKVYAARLRITNVAPEDYYGVLELVRDNPLILAQFRQYLTTGKFETDVSQDEDGHLEHGLAILDAVSLQTDFVMTGHAYMVGSKLISESLVARETLVSAGPPTATVPTSPTPIEELLRCLIDQSMIACMASKGLYHETGGIPDFGYADFSLILIAFLRHRLGELSTEPNPYGTVLYQNVGLRWECTDPNGQTIRHSHMNGYVSIQGPPTRHFLVDAQSGRMIEIDEACSRNVECIAKKAKEMLGSLYFCPDARFELPKLFPGNGEGIAMPGKWWKCKTAPPADPACPDDPEVNMWRRFLRYLQECCEERAGLVTSNCDVGLIPNPTRSPSGAVDCHSDWYIWN